jgi:hypothetical protein
MPPAWTAPDINEVDAAIAKMDKATAADVRVTKSGANIKMSDMIEPVDAGSVSKHGFTSCWTGGEIDDVECDFIALEKDVSDPREIFFKNQFRIVKRAETGIAINRFAGPGDSGSLIYTSDTSGINSAVGLVLAVGDARTSLNRLDFAANQLGDVDYTLGTPITVVINRLNEKLGSRGPIELATISLPPKKAG